LTTWYLEGDSSKTDLLEEYADIYASLRDLALETEPVGVTLRRVVGASGRLRLGTWTCDLPADGSGAGRRRKRPMSGPRLCFRSSIGRIHAPSKNGWPWSGANH
jgi:hypothetical protein